MNIIERIRDNFARGFFGKAMKIPELPEECIAWTLKQNGWIGVAVPINEYRPFSEKFAHVQIISEKGARINGKEYNLLMLICTDMELRREFATICSQFVEPGVNGTLRAQLIADPETWWKQWRALLGNTISSNEPYPVLGELVMLEYLLEKHEKVKWTGKDNATHDLELQDSSIEVKSTTKRYGYEVTISSIYQMIPAGKPLYLAFIRFERSTLGRSIDDVVKSLINFGYSKADLEKTLKSAGLEEGCTARNYKYKIIETKKYCVDESFPSVTVNSFKGDRLPDHVIKFSYTIDLAGISGTKII